MRDFYRQVLVAAKRFFRPDSFLRHFAVLASGTAFAQVISILTSPLLTRLYSPQDFAMMAVFMAVISMFTPFICGKYEVAMILPKDEGSAGHLLGISLYVSCFISSVLAVLLFVFGNKILSFLNAEKLGDWIYSVPMGLFLMGSFTAATYFANRKKDYSLMAQGRVIRALVTVVVTLIAGLVGASFGGMLIGFFVGVLVATSFLFYQHRCDLRAEFFQWCASKRSLLWEYRHYPLYNASTSLLDGFTLGMPVFFLSRYFSENIVGYYSLVGRVFIAPLCFVSASVSQINLKNVVDLVNNGCSPVPYLLKLAGLLFVFAMVPTVILFACAPKLFSIVFGLGWKEAGGYARILAPALVVRFVASTLSSTLGATNNNRLGALWKIIAFISTATVLCFFAPRRDIWVLLCALMFNDVFLYLLYFVFILYAAKTPRNFI